MTDRMTRQLISLGKRHTGHRFARRFATYKRDAYLSDLERLEQILRNPDRPVVLVFAGKAHRETNPVSN